MRFSNILKVQIIVSTRKIVGLILVGRYHCEDNILYRSDIGEEFNNLSLLNQSNNIFDLTPRRLSTRHSSVNIASANLWIGFEQNPIIDLLQMKFHQKTALELRRRDWLIFLSPIGLVR